MRVKNLILYALLASSLGLAADTPIEEKLVKSIFNGSTAQAFFDAEFAPAMEKMRKQGYSAETLAGAKSIIVAAVEALFSDPDFIKHFAEIYRGNFTDEELAEILDFYSTPTGQKMFSFMLLKWKEQGQFPQGLNQKHFGAMTAELERYFTEHLPEEKQGEADTGQPAIHPADEPQGGDKPRLESEEPTR